MFRHDAPSFPPDGEKINIVKGFHIISGPCSIHKYSATKTRVKGTYHLLCGGVNQMSYSNLII